MGNRALSRGELALLVVWAFKDQAVESAPHSHKDAQSLYHNVMALPTPEAAVVVRYARTGDVPPTDPLDLARWTRGLSLLRDMLQQPLSDLAVIGPDKNRKGNENGRP